MIPIYPIANVIILRNSTDLIDIYKRNIISRDRRESFNRWITSMMSIK
jgi:hypothetical protein